MMMRTDVKVTLVMLLNVYNVWSVRATFLQERLQSERVSGGADIIICIDHGGSTLTRLGAL